MWHQIQSKSPIWYFDATGGLTKSIAGQKDPNLYSMVCHDPITNQTIPVFEFVTTSHTSCNILRDRDLEKLNINFSDDDLSLVATKFPTSTDNESAINESSLVKGSPFAKYFDEAIDHNNQVIFSYNESQPSVVINPYFNEKLFTLIKQKLYFVSMWSGLLLDICVNTFPNHFDKKFNRLTNNIVEGYFGHIKHHTFQRYRHQLTSKLSTKLSTTSEVQPILR